MNKVNFLELDSSLLRDIWVVASEDQISRDLGGEAVILDMKSGIYFGLNEVGARIWQLIQEPINIDILCKTLLSEYNVEEEQCKNDILKLLQEMLAQKLIVIKNGKNI